MSLVLLVLGLTIGQKAYRLSLPTEGWSATPPVEAPIFQTNLLGRPSPLEPGDMLLAVAGQDYIERISRAVAFEQAPLDYRAGTTVRYLVSRDGRKLELDVPLYSWTAAGLARALWETLIRTPMGGIYMWLAYVIAAYVFWRRPRYRSAQLFFLLQTVTLSIAISGAVAQVSVTDTMSPALFYIARFSGDLFAWLLLPSLGLHFILVFPETRPPSRRTLALVYGVPWLVLGVVWVTALAPLVSFMVTAYGLLSFAAVLRMVMTLGNGPQRARVRWFAFGYGFSSLMTAVFYLQQLGILHEVPLLSGLLFEHCLCDLVYVACFAIAILWYRLFDIDVILSRTLVYGGLTALVIGIYVFVVVGLGRILQAPESKALSLMAAGIVAVMFAPLRDRLQRGVNHLLYGYRNEPYLALAQLGRRLEAASPPQAILPATVQTIAETLKLPYAAINLKDGVVASFGRAQTAREAFPLSYAGETLGQLVVSPRQAEENIGVADRRLLVDLSRQVGVAAHALLLQVDLERSRLRVVSAREEARRRLGNDLHDSVGHQLVALLRRAESAGTLLEGDPDAAKRLLAELVQQGKGVMEHVRSLAHQLHPPEIEVLGLVNAIRERVQAFDSGELHGHLEADDLPTLPIAIEVAAYYIVQEALGNVLRHAGARNCHVRLRLLHDTIAPDFATLGAAVLEVEILDDGRGLADGAQGGLGLRSMEERATELGGTCHIETMAHGGLRVLARLPCPAA